MFASFALWRQSSSPHPLEVVAVFRYPVNNKDRAGLTPMWKTEEL